jgi:hypothetical protein
MIHIGFAILAQTRYSNRLVAYASKQPDLAMLGIGSLPPKLARVALSSRIWSQLATRSDFRLLCRHALWRTISPE